MNGNGVILKAGGCN